MNTSLSLLERNADLYLLTNRLDLASQSIPTSNQIISWLGEMASLRKVLPKVSGLPPVMGK